MSFLRRIRNALPDRGPVIGGTVSAVVAAVAAGAIGQIGGAEGRILLEATLPTTRFLCGSMITASATILALMLTLLSVSYSSDHPLRPEHYERVRTIAVWDAVGFILSTVLLLAISIPLQESKNVPPGWYEYIYYGVLIASCVMAGFLIAIVLMLYRTLSTMIAVLGLGATDHPLVEQPEEDEEEEEGEREEVRERQRE